MNPSSEEIYASHSYRQEMMADIRSARLDTYEAHYQKTRLSGSMIKNLGLSHRIESDTLRSSKNYLLSMNSMCCLMAEYGGMDAILSHYMAEKYAILIEEATSFNQLDQVHADFLGDYLTPMYRSYNLTDLPLDKRINLYIENHFMQDLTVRDIANYFNFSREHLSRQYKELSGTTIAHQINQTRIEESKHFLTSTRLSITEIAT